MITSRFQNAGYRTRRPSKPNASVADCPGPPASTTSGGCVAPPLRRARIRSTNSDTRPGTEPPRSSGTLMRAQATPDRPHRLNVSAAFAGAAATSAATTAEMRRAARLMAATVAPRPDPASVTSRPAMFEKVLVANRGEIAIRVMRTLEELGIGSVAVYSEPDRDAPHARRADEAFLIGPGPASESYLVVEKIIEVAQKSGADAIHPGYGFLAENAAFARACGEAGVVFIGPPPEAIDAMGSKTKARELMSAAGVPIVPGTTDPVETVKDAAKIIDDTVGYPVAIKAAGGGGGKGFRVAESKDELEKAFEGAAREGEKFFSDPTVYIERYLPDPRHVEVQVLADSHGNVVHLFERDCSVQRRHQKVIEESPGPAVTPE